jgi:small subunit ribosomal protein S16
VTDSRNPRDGRFVEKLGTYNPVVEPKTFAIERSRYEYWTSKGALPSATLVQLLKKHPAKETVAG